MRETLTRRLWPDGRWAVGLALALLVSCRSQMAPAPATQPAALEVHFSPKGGCTEAIVQELSKARNNIYVQAYSFTSAPIAKALVDAKKRGVRVEAVLDKSNQTTKYSGATFLAHQGIHVRIDARHAIAHNKVMIIDALAVITGSFNFTKAAEENNAENLLIIRDDPKLAEQYLSNFRAHQAHSVPYVGPGEARTTGEAGAQAADEIAPEPIGDSEGGDESADDATRPAPYIGSRNSDVYHIAGCKDIGRISPANRVQYDKPPPGKRLHQGCPRK
jgi:phosphatidylserine/phosphatidylglycerophosphate/cardiolipin synthase-like enzyme